MELRKEQYKNNFEKFIFVVSLNYTVREKQIDARICKNKILAVSGYCLHNQLKFNNSIEFIIQFKIQV